MPALRLELRASRALSAGVLVVHALGAVALLLAVPGGAAGGVLALCVIGTGGAAAWERGLLRGPRSVRALELAGDGTLSVLLGSGRRLEASLTGRRHVGRWWVTLPLRGSWRTVLVARDMLSPAEFRRLRLWALWGRVGTAVRPAQAG